MPHPLDLPALALFTFAASITPGPNNLLLMRSGARFGLAPTGRHVLGIEAGMAGLVLLAHAGAGALLLALPAGFLVLHWGCFAYLLWLAWKVLRDDGAAGRDEPSVARPMGVLAAAAFQLVNPKAWMMAITAVSAFTPAGPATLREIAVVVVVFVAIGTPCMLAWAVWGATIHRVLHRPAARQAFNVAMAAGVAASAVLMLRDPSWT